MPPRPYRQKYVRIGQTVRLAESGDEVAVNGVEPRPSEGARRIEEWPVLIGRRISGLDGDHETRFAEFTGDNGWKEVDP